MSNHIKRIYRRLLTKGLWSADINDYIKKHNKVLFSSRSKIIDWYLQIVVEPSCIWSEWIDDKDTKIYGFWSEHESQS